MIKELFEKQKKSLEFFFEKVNLSEAEMFFEHLRNCQGVIFFTGVGKSGLIAEKIATTMTSIGTRAMYISPMNALHGDLGIISSQDIIVMLSKSGESDELLHLIPVLRNRSVKIASIVCQPKSRLAKASDVVMFLPIDQELCEFNLVPTSSTTVQIIFGDALAVALMNAKKFSLDQYASNHPAGRIGKRITLKVSDLMIRDEAIPLCLPTDHLINILVELSNKKCGSVLIVDQQKKLLGIFTDGDLRRSLQKYGPKALDMVMSDLMIKSPRQASPHQLAVEAMECMEYDQKKPITVLPVLEDEKVVGIIKLHDILQSGI